MKSGFLGIELAEPDPELERAREDVRGVRS